MPDIIDATAVAVAPADGGTLVPASPTMIRPVGSYEDILDAWHEFGRVKAALLTPDDYATIQDRTFIKRSGWRKIAAAFGISTTIVSEQKTLLTPEHDGVSGYVWNVVARAEAPNGRVADGDGACYSGERRFTKPWHDIRATAHCVPLRAEILTPQGFRTWDHVAIGAPVLSYSVLDDACYWVPLEDVSVFESLPMVQLEHHRFAVTCSPDHSWAIETEHGAKRHRQRSLCPADQFPTRGRLILAAPAQGGLADISSTEASLLGWLLTDGCLRSATGKEAGPPWRAQIDQSKPKYVEEIGALVAAWVPENPKAAQPTVTARAHRLFPQGHVSPLRPSYRFTLPAAATRELLARAKITCKSDFLRLPARLSQPARHAMLSAMLHADGTLHGGQQWVFGKTDPLVMEVFQLLATLEGYGLGRQRTELRDGFKPMLRQALREFRQHVDIACLNRNDIGPRAAWCPTTRYGTWVMRLDGQITITGNTRSINRAISNLVGGAELSAEEMEDPEPPQPRRVELPAPEPVGTDRDYSLVGKITSGQFTSHLRDSWEWTPADVCRVLWGREVEGGVNQYLKFRRRRGCADYGLGHLLHDLGGWHALHVPLPGLGPDVPGGRLGPDEEAD